MRFFWAGSDTAGCFGRPWPAMRVWRAAAPSKSARRKIHGPSSRGCRASISASFRSQSKGARRDSDEGGRLAKIEPGVEPVRCLAIDRDTIAGSQRGHAFAGPTIAVPCLQTVAVENACDDVVLGDQRQCAHSLDDIGGCAVALTPPAARQPMLGMRPRQPSGRSARSRLRRRRGRRWLHGLRVRTMRFLSRASVVGADQTDWKSRPARRRRPAIGRTEAVPRRHDRRCGARTRPRRVSARFQRASSSPATKRFSGSAASYWRKARSAA